MRRQILEVILLILLIVGIISNSLNVTGTIYDTNLANRKITLLDLVATKLFTQVFDELDALVTYIDNEITRIEIKNQINYAILDHKIENLKIQKPDFEKLIDGTVTIYHKGFVGAGVCIREDEDYYYILTVCHLIRDIENKTRTSSGDSIPESSMGITSKLETIQLFLTEEAVQEQIPLEPVTQTSVQFRNYTMVAGEFLYVNEFFDLAVLRIHKGEYGIEVLKLAQIYPEIGDEVYVLGHPLGRKYNLSKGIVSNLNNPFYMGVDAMMTFGNSGGGVFNTRGEIIGICSMCPGYSKEKEKNEKENNYRLDIFKTKK